MCVIFSGGRKLLTLNLPSGRLSVCSREDDRLEKKSQKYDFLKKKKCRPLGSVD